MNTRDKRSSAVNISMPWRGQLPQPGTQTSGDRPHVAFMYRGIVEPIDGGVGAGRDWIIRARRRGIR